MTVFAATMNPAAARILSPSKIQALQPPPKVGNKGIIPNTIPAGQAAVKSGYV